MKRIYISFILLPEFLFFILFTASAAGDGKHYYTTPPFTHVTRNIGNFAISSMTSSYLLNQFNGRSVSTTSQPFAPH